MGFEFGPQRIWDLAFVCLSVCSLWTWGFIPFYGVSFQVGTVGADLLIKSDETCRDLVDEAKNYLLLPQERPHMQGPRTRPRKPIRRGEVLFAVGGWCSGDAIWKLQAKCMCCTQIILFLYWHSEQFMYTACSDLVVFMHWTRNSMNNPLSYCGMMQE